MERYDPGMHSISPARCGADYGWIPKRGYSGLVSGLRLGRCFGFFPDTRTNPKSARIRPRNGSTARIGLSIQARWRVPGGQFLGFGTTGMVRHGQEGLIRVVRLK
jgi:hypothetical protein